MVSANLLHAAHWPHFPPLGSKMSLCVAALQTSEGSEVNPRGESVHVHLLSGPSGQRTDKFPVQVWQLVPPATPRPPPHHGRFTRDIWGAPGCSDGKESACSAGDPGSIPGWRRFPWRREWLPTAVLLPREFQGQRSLLGYSPWGPERVRHN